MGVAVLLKLVPDTTAKITVSGNRVEQASISKWTTSPYDEYALECAIQLKEAGYGEIVAITCGKTGSSKVLRIIIISIIIIVMIIIMLIINRSNIHLIHGCIITSVNNSIYVIYYDGGAIEIIT